MAPRDVARQLRDHALRQVCCKMEISKPVNASVSSAVRKIRLQYDKAEVTTVPAHLDHSPRGVVLVVEIESAESSKLSPSRPETPVLRDAQHGAIRRPQRP